MSAPTPEEVREEIKRTRRPTMRTRKAELEAEIQALRAEVARLRAMMPHPSWDDDAAGFIARLRDIATNTRLRCPKDKDESCATCHEAGEMLGVLEMLDAEREAVQKLRAELSIIRGGL